MLESLEPRKWQNRPDTRGFYLECGPIFRLKSLEWALVVWLLPVSLSPERPGESRASLSILMLKTWLL